MASQQGIGFWFSATVNTNCKDTELKTLSTLPDPTLKTRELPPEDTQKHPGRTHEKRQVGMLFLSQRHILPQFQIFQDIE